MANWEDGCTGLFWEAHYRSQALSTKAALLSCMAYVNLNPIRENMAESITSLMQTHTLHHLNLPLKPLLPFEGNATLKEQHGIPFSLHDYLQLVDHTERILRDDKRGVIALHHPPILDRLSIDRKTCLNSTTASEKIENTHFASKRRDVRSLVNILTDYRKNGWVF